MMRNYKRHVFIWVFVIAMVLLEAVGCSEGDIIYESPDGVVVSTTDDVSDEHILGNMIALTEKDILSTPNIRIVTGRIESIKNINIDFGGATVHHDAIIEIRVDKDLNGGGKQLKRIKALSGCAVHGDEWQEDSYTNSLMAVGDVGIFMVVPYAKDDYFCENGKKLSLCQLSQFGFIDPSRFAFIKKGEKLIYDHNMFKDLPAYASIEEVEEYICSRIEK